MTDTNNHPITPPLELVQQWVHESQTTQTLCANAARWGADQELAACCEWASQLTHYKDCSYGDDLLAVRRPEPKSLAEIASVIRRDLERLQGLEGQGDD